MALRWRLHQDLWFACKCSSQSVSVAVINLRLRHSLLWRFSQWGTQRYDWLIILPSFQCPFPGWVISQKRGNYCSVWLQVIAWLTPAACDIITEADGKVSDRGESCHIKAGTHSFLENETFGSWISATTLNYFVSQEGGKTTVSQVWSSKKFPTDWTEKETDVSNFKQALCPLSLAIPPQP